MIYKIANDSSRVVKNVEKDSVPCKSWVLWKHLRNNIDHSFTWTITSNAPKSALKKTEERT